MMEERTLEMANILKKGGRPRVNVDPLELMKYYRYHTTAETAEHFKCSKTTVYKICKRWRDENGVRWVQ